VHHQPGVTGAKSLGDDFLGLVQIVAGIDQIRRRLHRRRRTDLSQNRRHTVGMGKRRLAGIELLAGQQRLGKSARSQHRVDRWQQVSLKQRDDVRRRCSGLRSGFHGWKNAFTTAI
jgi:hypothetical protein